MHAMKPAQKPILKSLLPAALMAVALAAMPGCFIIAAGAAGAGTVAYVRGELDAPVAYSYERVVHASERAIDDLQFAKIKTTKDALSAEIIARTAEDKKIEILVRKDSDSMSTVKIRVGLFGDEHISRAILEKIQSDL